MLKVKDLIEGVEEQYIPMLKMVNIGDFTKCIAQFSGISVSNLKDSVIKQYLTIWAKNKYKFWKMLGEQLKIDTPFVYNHARDDVRAEVADLSKEYPVYSIWLDGFIDLCTNKIDQVSRISYPVKERIENLFPQYRLQGSSITHFFKSCLSAPDDLVTKIAAIYENQKVKATHTISIDPVDIMLSSENPYNWTSCYRLETDNESSHADGCLAATLDTTSLVTYIWNREGEFTLYNTYKFKNIRYKRMRQTIAISKNMTSIHFNDIYPGKGSYDEDFRKQLREIVEGIVAAHLNKENKWIRDEYGDCYREWEYGYSEYEGYNVFKIKGSESETIEVFDQIIPCPCGCGNDLPCSDVDSYESEAYYNGEGFTYENYEDRYDDDDDDYDYYSNDDDDE